MKKIFWADLEMTGLDVQESVIIEFAVLITDLQFNTLAEYHAVVYQPQEELDKMDEWNRTTHGGSGLLARIPDGKPLDQVETELLAFIDQYFDEGEAPVLSGNSIQQDRKFIDKYMPKLADRLHYRMIDVSSFKQIFRHCFNIDLEKNAPHRAVDDIHESIRELKYYLGYVKIDRCSDTS
ncbi:MAG: oligoribonuclease [Acidobacteriota bacterium]|nr:oligoribonuclease [Acidobacteriota bacterium]